MRRGVPVLGLAIRAPGRLIVASSRDDDPRAWLSAHARAPGGGWARRERFELPGPTRQIDRCSLSPDGSTLALVLRGPSGARCELYRLR